MDLTAHFLCHNVYAINHKHGFPEEKVLQIQNVAMNIDGKPSIKISLTEYDFYMNFDDWMVLKDEITRNIDNWETLTLSFTNLDNVQFTCASRFEGGRKYKVKFESDGWILSSGLMTIYSESSNGFFELEITLWSTFKSNVEKIFYHYGYTF